MLENHTNTAVRTALDGLLAHRFPQAVLLIGGDAPLRARLATHIAQSLLCTGAIVPCGTCNACHKVTQHTHPDLIFVADAQGGEMKVDLARTVREQVVVKPNDGNRKVFVVHEANQMNAQAQNALLKTLEEPPTYAFFVLTCPQADKLLETIRSRCVTFLLAPAPTAAQENGDTAPIAAFLQALSKADECAMLLAVLPWEKLDKPAFRAAISGLQTALRDAILGDKTPPLLPEMTAIATAVHARLSAQKLLAVYDHCTTIRLRSETNANPALQCAVLCAGAFALCYDGNALQLQS